MIDKDDPRIELVARAICQVHGFDPEREVVLEKNARESRWGPRWQSYRGKAREQIAAWDTLKKLEAEGDH